MIYLESECKKHNIIPKGIIHIGTKHCAELSQYISMGFKKIVYIEKNPEIYSKIKNLPNNNPNITIVNCIVGDVNSNEPKKITRTLDQLIIDIKQNYEDFNILNIESENFSISDLDNAKKLLKHVALINSKTIGILDQSLKDMFFTNIATDSYGSVYISDNIIQVSTIGINGRFANQVFQHMFASVYAFEHNLKTEFPTWIGQQLFNLDDNPITRTLEKVNLENKLPEESLVNKDVIGWFQYHISYYRPYIYYIKEKYRFKPELRDAFDKSFKNILQDKSLVVIHIRKTDYGYNDFFIAPIKWYADWFNENFDLENSVLYIASDDSEIYKQFEKYKPITAKDIKVLTTQATFLTDFYAITQANYLAISNSSFSFLGSMLSDKLSNAANACVRPSLKADKLIDYNPWNTDVLLKEKPLKHQDISGDKLTRKLHIGGQEYHPDWEILNLDNNKNTDHVGNAGNLFKFEDNTFDEIYASHVLEHFDYIELDQVLSEWHRVLKPDGLLSVSVPDLLSIFHLMSHIKKNPQAQMDLIRMVFGGHIDKNDYHQMGFTFDVLYKYLEIAGFKNIKKIKLLNNIFSDTSSMRYDNCLISLNVTATK